MEAGQEGLLQDPFVNLIHGSPLQKNLVVCVRGGGGVGSSTCWNVLSLSRSLSLFFPGLFGRNGGPTTSPAALARTLPFQLNRH